MTRVDSNTNVINSNHRNQSRDRDLKDEGNEASNPRRNSDNLILNKEKIGGI